MSEKSPMQLHMRNIPWGLWASCGLFVLIGLLPLVVAGTWAWLILVVGGLLAMALLTNITSLTADRDRGTVTLSSWTVRRGTQRREIPSRDITQVSIEQSAGDEEPVFRVTLVLASGELVPLTDYYAGTRGDKLAAAQRLSDFLEEERGSDVPVVDAATTSHEQTGHTAGIYWRLETLSGADGTPVMRWSTTAGGYADGLLILSEIDAGFGALPWDAGVLGAVSKRAFKALLLSYRFKEADVEAVEAVQPLQDVDPRLRGCYVTFATIADTARGWLTPARVDALAEWAKSHPTPHLQSGSDVMLGAVLVLAAPSGLWLVFRGATYDPACIGEIAALGAALAGSVQNGHRSP